MVNLLPSTAMIFYFDRQYKQQSMLIVYTYVAISSKTKDEHQGSSNENPNWCYSISRCDHTSRPHVVNGRERSNTIASSATFKTIKTAVRTHWQGH